MADYLQGKIFLKDDPFKIGAPAKPQIWASSQEIKMDLEKIIGNMLVSESSTINIMWGILGTGKTYTANYFIHKGLREVISDLQEKKILKKKFEAFSFPRFVTSIGGRRDIQFLEMLVTNVGLSLRRSKRAIEIFQKAFSEKDDYVVSTIEDSTLSFEINSALKGNVKPETFFKGISEMILPSDPKLPLTRLPNILAVFTFVMKILTHPKYGFKRVFLWIDEVEKFGDMPPVEKAINNTFFRDCVDILQERVHIFLLNTTARSDVAELTAYVDDFVFNRIAYIYELTQISKEEWAMEYVRKLLQHFRTKKAPDDLPPYFPFTEGCVRTIIKGEKEKYEAVSPRDINIKFEKALASLRRERLEVNPTSPINFEQLKEIAIF